MAQRHKPAQPAASPTVDTVAATTTFEALVLVAVRVAAEPWDKFREHQPVRDAIRRRVWTLAHRDPDLARKLRRMTGPAPPASSVEATAKWKMARDFRVAESIADDYRQEQAGR